MNIPDLYCRVPADWLHDPSLCWFEWQTFLGSGAAILIGAGTIYFLWGQIKQSDRHEAARLDRRHQAVRATLPLTLSGLCAWCREMAHELDRAKSEMARIGADKFAGQFDPPDPPDEYVRELQSVIETTDDTSVIEPISEVIRELQKLWARTTELNDAEAMKGRVGVEENVDDYIIQTAQVYALIESLFDYARSETEQGPDTVEWGRVYQFLMRLGIETKDLFETIERRRTENPAFWVRDDR